jgi:SAM-dependent methyltransferase
VLEDASRGTAVTGAGGKPMPRADAYVDSVESGLADRYVRNYKPYGTHEVVLRLIPDGVRVLDVGCAAGYLGAELTNRGSTVFGVDVDEAAVKRAGGFYHDIRCLNLETATSLPWPRGSFDVIVAADVLEHLRDPRETLAMLASYLRSGGTLIVSLPNIAHFSVRVGLLLGRFRYTRTGILDETHLRFFTFDSACDLVSDSGVEIAEVIGASDRFGRFLQANDTIGRALRGLLAFNIIIVARRRRRSVADESLRAAVSVSGHVSNESASSEIKTPP